jgi:2,4-dienoyl-CoA reductase (NADPH2)
MKLLTPIRIGPLEVSNRAVSTAHGTGFWPWRRGGSLDRYIEYQRSRAGGGPGMIITEGIWLGGLEASDLAALTESLARFADAMHAAAADIRVVLQLSAWGGHGQSQLLHPNGEPLQSFNGMQSDQGEPSHRMTDGEIRRLVELHGLAARLATANGFDGVELHASHGYLLHQSMSPWGNGRNDEWGEPLAFARLIVATVRDALGTNKILGLRVAVDDDRAREDGGQTPDELAGLAKNLVGGGAIDYLNVGMGSRMPAYGPRTARSYRYEPGVDLPLSANLRRTIEARVPVIGVGRILTPAQAEAALKRGDCDLVALTRAQIADPDFMAKLRSEEGARIRPCVGANDCANAVLMGSTLVCFHNPAIGREPSTLVKTKRAKHVLVIGAGPAGLSAAEITARRGHDVTVVDAADEPGGHLRHVRATEARELYRAVEWLLDELGAAGVIPRLRTHVDATLLEELAPDAVILASGAKRLPGRAFPGADSARVVSSFAALTGPIGQRVLVLDRLGDMEACLVAETLIKRGAEVTFTTPLESLAPRAGYMQLYDLKPIFRQARCEVFVETDIESLSGNAVRLVDRRNRSHRDMPIDTVVAVTIPVPETSLEATLKELALPYWVVGDALAPRGVGPAIRDGDRAARNVE